MQWEITHQTKNQENRNLNDKSQSADANPENSEMLEVPDKDFKA